MTALVRFLKAVPVNPNLTTASLRLWLTLALIAAVGGTGAWMFLRQHATSDAARTAKRGTSASENRHGFVGNDACVRCHTEEATKYATSGHAHTFHEARAFELSRNLAGKTFHDEERQADFHYELDSNGLSVSLPKQFGNDRFPLTYAFGSGLHAVTFLTLLPNRVGETVGLEHRVSLFQNGTRLALTPNHRGRVPAQTVEHFGKVVKDDKLESCIGCHTTFVEIEEQELKHLIPHVGCESCHGPGAKHIAAVEQKKTDLAVEFAPSRQTAESQVRMCGRCHRIPEVLTEPPSRQNPRLVRFQPIGLMQSRCFQQSNGRLSCTTCHDPHQAVSHDTTAYVRRCVSCHSPQAPEQKPCRVSPSERCIECHMPPVEVYPTISFHDHWIRVRDANDPTSAVDSDHTDDHAEPPPPTRKD